MTWAYEDYVGWTDEAREASIESRRTAAAEKHKAAESKHDAAVKKWLDKPTDKSLTAMLSAQKDVENARAGQKELAAPGTKYSLHGQGKEFRSPGRLGITKDQREVYVHSGNVYTAPLSNVADVNTGARIGRWEVAIDHPQAHLTVSDLLGRNK